MRPLTASFCYAGSVLCLIALQTGQAWAQNNPPPSVLSDSLLEEEYEFRFDFAGDFGLSRIEESDGAKQRYFATAIMPEFFYGPFSAGLLFRLHLHARRLSSRKEDYDSANDYLSLIRYLQYAEKGDPGYYARFGELEDATLGFGQFINLYQNSISLDEQKRGFEVNYNAGHYLVEAIYSNLLAAEVFGVRGAFFPLAEDPISRYKQLSVGASLAGDLSSQGTQINTELPGAPFLIETVTDPAINTGVGVDDGRLLMAGLDASLPVFVTETSAALAYAGLSKIFNYGSGLGVGLQGTWNLPEDLRLQMQLEQRLLGKRYLPNYFNPLYEAARLQQVGIPVEDGDDLDGLNSKRNSLNAQTKVRFGSYVTMAWRWKRIFRLRWSFEHSWNLKDSGWFHFDTRIQSPEVPVYLRLRFDNVKTTSLQDIAISGNNLNFLRFETAFRVMSMLMLGIAVRNSFEPEFREGIPVGLKKRRRIEPKFVFTLPQ